MYKQWLILISIYYSIFSSVQAVILNEEEKQNLQILQSHASNTNKTWEDTKEWLQKEYKETPKQWFHPSQQKLDQLVELSEDPKSVWPSELFPTSFVDPTHSGKETLSQQYTHKLISALNTEDFSKRLLSFIKTLNKRKENGLGLKAHNQKHLENCQFRLDLLDKLHKALDVRLEDSNTLISVFANHLSTFEEQLILSSQKKTTSKLSLEEAGISKDDYIKAKLFFDAGLYVYEMNLDTLGNFMWLYALVYRELGDNSLEKEFLTMDKEFRETSNPNH